MALAALEYFLRLPLDEQMKVLAQPLPTMTREPLIEVIDPVEGSLGFVIPTLKPSRKYIAFPPNSEPTSTKG